MTTCLSTTLTRIGGISSATERIGGDIACFAARVDDAKVSATKTSGLSCSMYQVCRTNVNMHYLEISPKIVWMLAGHTENQVFSDTKWLVQ